MQTCSLLVWSQGVVSKAGDLGLILSSGSLQEYLILKHK